MRVMGLAALVATLMGCSVEGGGAGGSSVGDLIAQPDHIVVTVNLVDGFAAPEADDRWELDVTAHSLVLNGGAPVSLTAAQSDALVAAVVSADYHTQPDCLGTAIDGAPYPPQLTVGAGGASHQLGVSDAECAASDHSAHGEVIGCGDFGAVYNLLEAAAPSGHTFSCASYW